MTRFAKTFFPTRFATTSSPTRFAKTFLMLFPIMALAQSGPEPISPFVNDFAEIIDAETQERITQDLSNLRTEKGVEMTVVTINRTTDYGPALSVPDFTTNLMNQWGVGDASLNNGVMFLVSLQDREMFIGLGSGYPTPLTTAWTGFLINT